MNPNILEININNFIYNIKLIKEKANAEIMPVFKANAYGTYLNKNLDVLNMFNIICVANVTEGIEIRKIGYKKDIFILNQPYIEEIPNIIENNLIIGISNIDFLKELGKYSNDFHIHIELDTGMGRCGLRNFEIPTFLDNIPNNVIVDGIYTHLSSADNDPEYTNLQYKLFDEGINIIKERIPNIKWIHANASNGIVNFNNKYNLVRPGIIMYGYKSSPNINIDLKPIATLKSKITFIKDVKPNSKISYNGTFITKRNSIIATIPLGYNDGIRRSLSNTGYVVIHNQKAPIVGNVCMDSFMVDVTDIKDVNLNDDVYIWDNNLITIEDIATICNTINYEILCNIGPRVNRIFINK